jgi:hypothetical protein
LEDVFVCHKALPKGRCSATPRTCARPVEVILWMIDNQVVLNRMEFSDGDIFGILVSI